MPSQPMSEVIERASFWSVPSRRWVVGTIGVVFMLVLSYLAGLLTPDFGVPDDASAEAGFARDMSEHHAQAVEMSMIAYQRATMHEVGTLAYDIALAQQGQIGTMQDWLKDWQLLPTSSRPAMAWMPDAALGPGARMPGMASREDVKRLRDAEGKTVDVIYAQLMLRHHLGGIHMVDGVLKRTSNPRVRELAQAMRNGQSLEVEVLNDLLDRLDAQPL